MQNYGNFKALKSFRHVKTPFIKKGLKKIGTCNPCRFMSFYPGNYNYCNFACTITHLRFKPIGYEII
jgi:hypothetical protein